LLTEKVDLRIDVSIPHRKFKNIFTKEDIENDMMFPSLIGSLKTRNANQRSKLFLLVSIPHRKFKNFENV